MKPNAAGAQRQLHPKPFYPGAHLPDRREGSGSWIGTAIEGQDSSEPPPMPCRFLIFDRHIQTGLAEEEVKHRASSPERLRRRCRLPSNTVIENDARERDGEQFKFRRGVHVSSMRDSRRIPNLAEHRRKLPRGYRGYRHPNTPREMSPRQIEHSLRMIDALDVDLIAEAVRRLVASLQRVVFGGRLLS